MSGLLDIFTNASGAGGLSMLNVFKNAADTGGNVVKDHPVLAALAGTLALRKVENHGLVRNVFDFLSLCELFRGNAGTLAKLNLAEDAREAAIKVSQKMGAGNKAQQMTGFAAAVGGFIEMSRHQNTPNPKPAP